MAGQLLLFIQVNGSEFHAFFRRRQNFETDPGTVGSPFQDGFRRIIFPKIRGSCFDDVGHIHRYISRITGTHQLFCCFWKLLSRQKRFTALRKGFSAATMTQLSHVSSGLLPGRHVFLRPPAARSFPLYRSAVRTDSFRKASTSG